jgi:hypothetical protein
VFLALQALWRTQEMGWLSEGLSQWHGKPNRLQPGVSNG